MKTLGVEAILVGHEHCNSASVVYEGVRLQYGQKISTYDRANFVNSDGSIIGAYYGDIVGTRTPLMGGTVLPLSTTDGSSNGYISFSSDTAKIASLNFAYEEWTVFAIDISSLGESCTEFAYVIPAGNVIYLKDIMVE